jgi:hypothetical protein
VREPVVRALGISFTGCWFFVEVESNYSVYSASKIMKNIENSANIQLFSLFDKAKRHLHPIYRYVIFF